MKIKIRKICAALLTALLISLISPVSLTAAASEPVTITVTQNTISKFDGFDYEYWIQNKGENASMTLTGNGKFDCSWEGVFNVLFRMGKKLGSTKNYNEYGEITLDYAAEHNITSGDVSYLCVYGWTENPLVEFYIIENRGSYKPPGGTGFKGTVEIDGGKYEIFESTRTEQPSIQGTKTFQQYWSVRVSNRTEGIISVSEHFKAWEECGMDMSGAIYEIALCVEGFRTSGNADISRHILTIGDTVYGGDKPEEPEELTENENEIESETETESESFEEPVTASTGDDSGKNNFPVLPVTAVGAAVIIIIIAVFLSGRKKG